MEDVVPQRGDLIQEKYRIEGLLGEGGMGSVYEAVHEGLDKVVAIKFLSAKLLADERAVRRFQREARAAAAIGHPGIVDVTDIGVADDGSPFIVMERLEGLSLADRLAQVGRLDLSTTAFILCQVLSALHAAHEKGILHRDLKPDNVFLQDAGRELPDAKVLDFGISKFLQTDAKAESITMTGAVLGTPFYMSPEQATGDSAIDGRADLFSVGVILYQCLTGKLPFAGVAYGEVIAKILTQPVAAPSSHVGGLPEEVDEIVLRALKKPREERYESAEAFLAALLPFVEPHLAASLPVSSSFRASYSSGFVSASSAPRSEPPPPSRSTPSGTDETLLDTPETEHPLTPPSRAAEPAPSETAPPSVAGYLAESAESDPVGRGSGRRWLLIVAGLCFVALFLVGLMTPLLLRTSDGDEGGEPQAREASERPPVSRSPEDRPRADSTGRVDASSASASGASKTVRLRIAATPATATITIDGAAVEGNPIDARVPLDGMLHRIEVRAEGYEPWSRAVVYDSDIIQDVSLTKRGLAAPRALRAKRSAAPPAQTAAPGAPAAPPTKAAPAGSDSDPWAGEPAKAPPPSDDPWRD